ncbi:MAG: hypothetical protein JJE13_05790 [Thermoleophilia bacterium]|nr:hypothetical protein [Thermoleophilia bacterium]
MKDRITKPVLGLVLGLTMLFAFTAAPASAANKVPVNLRVVTYKGKILFDGKIKTGTAKVKPNTACLGGKPGKARTLTGPTGFGVLVDAAKQTSALRPLKVSDGQYGFGLCGFGSTVAKGVNWWALKYQHKQSSTGGELTKLKKGSSVLWYLAEDYNVIGLPEELALKAPAKVKANSTVKVRVLGYDDTGKKRPIEGAKLDGVSGAPLTDRNGYAKVTIKKKTRLRARFSGAIPSNHVAIGIKK